MYTYIKKYSILILFITFISLFSLVDLLKTPKDFSELENRNLTQKPTFTSDRFISGKFSSSYEKYINDQFVLRDQWISLKSRAEFALGKIENNGIIYGKDHYLFDKLQTYSTSTVETNLGAIRHFLETYSIPTTFALIPNSYAILEDKVPQGAYLLDQLTLIDQLYAALPDTLHKLDLAPILQAHADESIYYRTDHHWTTYGAYLGYSEWIRSLGMTPTPLTALNGILVPDFYGTYFSKAKNFNAISDTITYYPIDAEVTIDGTAYPGLYDPDQWDTRDKYAGFLWGNNGVTVIKSPTAPTPSTSPSKVIVFKDSFGNAFVPFLTAHFDEVHVIDLRALPLKLSDYMAQHQFDQALILYNVTNFIQDTNIARFKQ